MGVDIEAIRRRVAELNGQRKNSNIQMWKPTPGEYKIRGVPWKENKDGMPLMELEFYYLGNEQGFLAPKQFGKPDPINDLIRKLYNSGKPADRELAKGLHPKMRAYMALVVRGQEDKGVQVWSFGKPIYNRLLSFWTEEDVGDILDPNRGFDLKVKIVPNGKMFNGKPSYDTFVDAARSASKLFDDQAKVKSTLESVPNLMDMYKQKSPAEVETLLNNYLNGPHESTANEGTSKGGQKSEDALDLLVKEAKVAASKSESEDVHKKATKKVAKKADDEDETPVLKKSIDDAFDELLEDGE